MYTFCMRSQEVILLRAVYGLVEFFLPASAIAAPAPPPAIATTIATFAPVDIPPPLFGVSAAGCAGWLAGRSVLAFNWEAALRQPPVDLGVMFETLTKSVAIFTEGFPVDALHVSDITIPRGVELETDVEATVVAGQPPRVQTTDDAEAEAAAEAAGEAAGDAGEAADAGSGDSESSEG